MNASRVRGDLRQRLLEAAQSTIAASGLSGVSARGLAEQAGCSVTGIYRVFGDIDSLILEVNLATLLLFESSLVEIRATGFHRTPEGARAALVRLALAYLDFALAHPLRWRALFEFRWSRADQPVPSWYTAEQGRLFSHIEAPLRAIRPDLGEEALVTLARSLFSVTHGLVSLGLDQRLGSISPDVLVSQIEVVVGAMAVGLAQTAPRPAQAMRARAARPSPAAGDGEG